MLLWLIQGKVRQRRKPQHALARICVPIISLEMEDAEYFPLVPLKPLEVLYCSLILDAVLGSCGVGAAGGLSAWNHGRDCRYLDFLLHWWTIELAHNFGPNAQGCAVSPNCNCNFWFHLGVGPSKPLFLPIRDAPAEENKSCWCTPKVFGLLSSQHSFWTNCKWCRGLSEWLGMCTLGWFSLAYNIAWLEMRANVSVQNDRPKSLLRNKTSLSLFFFFFCFFD